MVIELDNQLNNITFALNTNLDIKSKSVSIFNGQKLNSKCRTYFSFEVKIR